MELQMIADYQCKTGEGPLWHPQQRRLYWVDIPAGRLFYYEPDTGEHRQCYEDDAIGGFTIQQDGALLLFGDGGFVKTWRDGNAEVLIDELPAEADGRFNDVIADPAGRVFCGTMSTDNHPARLYRLDTDGSITQILDGIGTSNGMGFTRDHTQMYYTDTGAREIYLFDYDKNTGTIDNQRVFVRVPEQVGKPDGMTVDADGYVWSAMWDGGCIVRYHPDGAEEDCIQFPAKKVSCVTFGGDDYRDMYVTTAGGDNKQVEGDGAGALFRVSNSGIQGVAEFRSNISI